MLGRLRTVQEEEDWEGCHVRRTCTEDAELQCGDMRHRMLELYNGASMLELHRM